MSASGSVSRQPSACLLIRDHDGVPKPCPFLDAMAPAGEEGAFGQLPPVANDCYLVLQPRTAPPRGERWREPGSPHSFTHSRQSLGKAKEVALCGSTGLAESRGKVGPSSRDRDSARRGPTRPASRRWPGHEPERLRRRSRVDLTVDTRPRGREKLRDLNSTKGCRHRRCQAPMAPLLPGLLARSQACSQTKRRLACHPSVAR